MREIRFGMLYCLRLQRSNRRAERAIARASSILSEEEIYLRECTEQAVREFRRVDGYDAKKLRTLPLAIRRRAAVFILETEAGGADYAAVKRFCICSRCRPVL